jgi:hypothetical protein
VWIRRLELADVCVVAGQVDFSSVMDEVHPLSEQLTQLEATVEKMEMEAIRGRAARAQGETKKSRYEAI